MIGVVTVKVSAGNPRAPLCTVPVFVGSDCTLAVTDVPDRFFGVAVTSVAVAVMNASGSETSVSCTRSGPAWCCTVPAAFFDRPGEVRRGVVVSALGVREDGQTEARWILGVGQLDVMEMGCVPAPGVAWQDVHLRDEVPPDPVKGDLAKHGETWKIYTGEVWESLGSGGGGGGAVESVNGQTGKVVLSAADVGARPAGWTPTAAEVGARPATWTPTASDVGALSTRGGTVNGGIVMYGQTGATDLQVGAGGYGGSVAVYSGAGYPASIRKDDEEVATENQLMVSMDLVGDNPYSIKLGEDVLSYAQIKSIAESRHAVIRHGRGTYRVTYIGASEMMWDCTGTVQGEVQTGQIHIFAAGDVVQLVGAKELAPKTAVDAVSAMAAYPIEIIVGGVVKDRTVNVCEGGGVITFPGMRSDGCVRDFVVRVPAMDTAPTVVFPSYVRYESWQDAGDIWTAEAGKANEWYFSESEPGIFKVVHQALAVVAQ